MLLPVILIGSFSVLLCYFPISTYRQFLSSFAGGSVQYLLFMIQLSTLGMLPVYLTAAINLCYTAASEEGQRLSSRLASLLSALTGFFILSGIFTADFDIKALGSQDLFVRAVTSVFSRMHRSFASGFLFILLVSLLWCFGIHGNKVLDTVAVDMSGPLLPGEIVSKSFIDIFVYIGGTGTLLGLVISLFIFGRTANSRKLAKMSFAPCFSTSASFPCSVSR